MIIKKDVKIKLKNGNELIRNQDGLWAEVLQSGIEIMMDEKEALETLIEEMDGYYNNSKVTVINEEPTVSVKRSISVDVGTHGNPGIMEYRVVWSDTGEEIYHSKEYPVGTNNLGEFLAVVHAIGYVRKENLNIDIYSDSQTALAWVRNKQYKTNLVRNNDTELLFKHLDRAINYLKNNQPYEKLHKWNTALHGEIKADFGRK